MHIAHANIATAKSKKKPPIIAKDESGVSDKKLGNKVKVWGSEGSISSCFY